VGRGMCRSGSREGGGVGGVHETPRTIVCVCVCVGVCVYEGVCVRPVVARGAWGLSALACACAGTHEYRYMSFGV